MHLYSGVISAKPCGGGVDPMGDRSTLEPSPAPRRYWYRVVCSRQQVCIYFKYAYQLDHILLTKVRFKTLSPLRQKSLFTFFRGSVDPPPDSPTIYVHRQRLLQCWSFADLKLRCWVQIEAVWSGVKCCAVGRCFIRGQLSASHYICGARADCFKLTDDRRRRRRRRCDFGGERLTLKLPFLAAGPRTATHDNILVFISPWQDALTVITNETTIYIRCN